MRGERRGIDVLAREGGHERACEGRARGVAGADDVAAGEERADEPVVRGHFPEMRNRVQRKRAEVIGKGDSDLRALLERHQLRG